MNKFKHNHKKYLYLIILILVILIYIKFISSSKLTCEKLKSEALCIEIDISTKTDDLLRYIYPHKFPNYLAYNDEVYIKNLKIVNNANKKTKETPLNFNFVPLEKRDYDKTPYDSENVGGFSIVIPSLEVGDTFRVVNTNFNNYDVFLNDKINRSFSHWYIDLFRPGEWKIEYSFIGGSSKGETDFNWIINEDLNWGGTFNVLTNSEFSNQRNNFFILLLTIVTIILAIYSIIRQNRDSRRSIVLLNRIKDSIIETNENTLKSEEIRHLRYQIGLLSSLSTELEVVSSEIDKIKLISKDYEIKGNLEWFLESLNNKQIPLHDMWQIEPFKYLSGLGNEIVNISLKDIKKILVLINQKISLINFYRVELISEAKKIYSAPQKQIDDNTFKIINKNTIKTIEEVIEIVKSAKIVVNEYIDKINKEVKRISAN